MAQANDFLFGFAKTPPALSRRTLLAGIATLPGVMPPPMAPATDPVATLWEEWQRAMAEADALCGQWSGAEQALARSIGWNTVEAAVTANAAGTQDMNAIAERQDALDRFLDDLGHRILALPSQNIAGIIAKLSLALALADPTQRDELEWRLVQNALSELHQSAPR